MTLNEINDIISRMSIHEIEKEWKHSIPFKVILFSSDLTAKSLTGRDITKANKKHGVYRWRILDQTIYIGRATESTIGQRQNSHLTSFRNIHNRTESTGRKLREYMQSNKLNDLAIEIDYIDMSSMHNSIEWFEKKCIQHWKPLLNTFMKS